MIRLLPANFYDTTSNKALFNQTFSKYVHRDWLDANVCSLDEFRQFIERHNAFIAKPVEGTGGKGTIKVMSDYDTIENLYQWCKENQMIVEEVVKQHPDMAEVNDSSLNTVRVVTLLGQDGNVHITVACYKFGRKGKIADNFHQDACGGCIDIETGEIYTDAITREHLMFKKHPDSGIEFKGRFIPHWKKIRECVMESAKIVPSVKYIGWDVAVNSEGNVELIEGNSCANVNLIQAADQIGKKYIYDPIIKEIALQKGIHFPKSEVWYR